VLNKFPHLQCNCFNEQPTLINGIPVSAETLQPILDALYANDLFLKSVLDYFDMPSALLRCVEIDPEVKVGQPVYYSDQTERFELAQYASVISESGQVFLTETAEVWGIVRERISTDTAVILICGMSPVDLSESVADLPAAGKYYLSDIPGMLSPVPPDDVAPVYVLTTTADGTVLFRPWSGEYAGLVLQWRHELFAVAAGEANVVNGQVVVTNTNNTLPGWLPADDPVFDGNAPAGAVFGYNIAADLPLAAKWPPRFLGTVHLDFDRGSDPYVGGTSVPLGSDGLAVVDANGIWWLNDCEADTPFDPDMLPGSPPGDCPRVPRKKLTMYAARPAGFMASDNLSLSLRAIHPALRVLRRNTTSLATTGDLDVALDTQFLLSQTSSDLHGFAVKRSTNNQLARGPVVTSIKSTSPQLLITGSNEYGATGDFKHGEVTIESTGISSPVIHPQTTALNRAEEEVVYGTLGIGLPTIRDASFRSKFVVPGSFSGNANISFRVWIMANFQNNNAVVVTTEQLALSVKIVPPPSPSTNVAALTEVSVSIPVSNIENGKAFQQVSDTFAVPAGAIVYAELARSPGNAAYEMHAINHFLFIESISA
jgi:hypothetical protein